MNQHQHTHDEVAYVDALLKRLLEHYLTNTALPSQAEKALTPALVHLLSRCVIAEGYGQ